MTILGCPRRVRESARPERLIIYRRHGRRRRRAASRSAWHQVTPYRLLSPTAPGPGLGASPDGGAAEAASVRRCRVCVRITWRWRTEWTFRRDPGPSAEQRRHHERQFSAPIANENPKLAFVQGGRRTVPWKMSQIRRANPRSDVWRPGRLGCSSRSWRTARSAR